MDRFKEEGYDVITNIKYHFSQSLRFEKSLLTQDFVQLIIHLSLFRIIENELVTNQLRKNTLLMLDYVKDFRKKESPIFMYLHFILPHSPFIFNPDGSRTKYFESAFGKFEDRDKFIEQVIFTGTEIIKIVDMLREKDPDAIIIIQADHGYGAEDDMKYLNRNSTGALNDRRERIPPSHYLDQRFGIFSAIYSPIDLEIKEKSTPVNLFRSIFSKIFSDNNEHLPDSSYFALIKQPYMFHNITDSLNNVNSQLTD